MKAITVSEEVEKELLEGQNPKIVQLITPDNGMPNGQWGKLYDWSKFDWEGKAIHIDECHARCCNHSHEDKAYPAYVDRSSPNYEYLHVPYDWAEECTVYRIWPVWEIGDKVRVNRKFKLLIEVEAIKAEQVEGKWAWVILYQRVNKCATNQNGT